MNPIEKAIKGKTMALPTDRTVGIQILEGVDGGHAFILSKKSRVTFGRDEADVDLQDPAVSKLHCAIEVYDDVVVLRDLDSTSGSFLNGFQIKEDLLKSADKIKLGNTTLQILIKKKD